MEEDKKEEVIEEENVEKNVEEEKDKTEMTPAIAWLTRFEDFFLNIADAIKLKFLADIYRKNRELWRYLIFGALTTLVNIVTYMFAQIPLGNAMGNVVAWVAGVIFAYVTNRYFVFDSHVADFKGLLKEIVSFVSCRLATFFVDEGMMILTVDMWHWNNLAMKIIANIIVIVLNYIFSKLIIFKKKEEK